MTMNPLIIRFPRPFRILAILGLLLGILASGSLPAVTFAADQPSITTSKDDYAPAELVDLSGAGWQADESIELFVNDDEGQSWSHRATVTADVNGAFEYVFRLPDWFVATYTVVATGQYSGTATTTFTDDIARGTSSFGSNGTSGASAELTISAPAVSVGDVLVAQIVVAKDLQTNHTICTPPGWTSVLRNDFQFKIVQQTFYYVAPSNQGATSHTWQLKTNSGACGTSSSPLTGKGASGGIIRYTGVDTSNPIDVYASSAGSSSGPYRAPPVTTTAAGAQVIRFFGAFKDTTINPATRIYLERSSNNSAERTAAAFDANQAAAGSTGTFDATFGSSAEWVAQTVALRMAAPAGPTATSLAVQSATGTYGGTVNLAATLTAGGSGVNGKSINFTLNGTPVGSATTNSAGTAMLNNVSLGSINAGNYPTGVGASFAGDSSHAASNGSNSLTVNQANQVITFTSPAPSPQVGDTYTPAATGGGSGNPVTFGASGACSYNSGTGVVTMTGVGACTVTADQAGNGNYNAAPQATQVFSVSPPADGTAPVITPDVSGTLGDNGWYTSDVTVSWSVVDNESAVSSTSGCDPTTINADTAGQTLTCTATSAGGTSSESVTIKRDTTAPTASASASPAPNANGWNNTNVTVSFSGSDNLSSSVSCSASVTLSSEGTGQSASGTCTDLAGNESAPATASGINIDKTAPTTISFVGSINDGDQYYYGFVPAAPTCTADGAISGLTAAGCMVSGYSTAKGSHTLTASATDLAGNTGTATISYTVLGWTLYGFYNPVNMTSGVWNTVKGGSTVPLKFELFAGPTELTDTSLVSFSTLKVSCPGTNPEDPVDVTMLTSGNTNLRYDWDSGQFIQNWKTPKESGKCYEVTLTASDGSKLVAKFELK